MGRQNSSREWHGNYRAKVVEVDIEGNNYGAIRVFVPDLFASAVMIEGDPSFNENNCGLIAYPANNCMGGYNTEDAEQSSSYQACIHVPLKNSWVWVFFEGGDPARPFYTNAVMYRNSKVLPENRGVAQPHKVYTLCKTHSGQSIVVCDSPDQRRIEITGKKRLLSGGPEGNSASVYAVDGNMTTILFDERKGKEKILIRSRKGDYIHFDIDERQFQSYFKSNIRFQTDGNVDIAIKGNLTVKIDGNITLETGGDHTIKNGGNNILESGGIISSKSASSTSIDSDGVVLIQNPSAQEAPKAIPIPPLGFRGI